MGKPTYHPEALVFAILREGGLGLCGHQGMTPGRQSDCTGDLLYSLLSQLLEHTSAWDPCFFIKAHMEALEGAVPWCDPRCSNAWSVAAQSLCLEFAWSVLIMERALRNIL